MLLTQCCRRLFWCCGKTTWHKFYLIIPKSMTMKSYIVRRQVMIKGTPSQVWDALTNPEKTKEYFFNCEVHSDWQQGSAITFKGRIFLIKKIEMTGTILRIEPQKLLEYTLKNGDEEDNAGFSTVTDILTYDNGVTTLSIADDVGDGEGAEIRYERSEKGWDSVLEGLKELVEKENGIED